MCKGPVARPHGQVRSCWNLRQRCKGHGAVWPLLQERGGLGPQGPGVCRRLVLPALGPLGGNESVQEAASPGTGQPLAACPGPSAVLGGRSWAGAAGTRGSGSPGKGQPGLARRLDLAVLEAPGSAGGSSIALGAEGPPPEQEWALGPSPSWPPGSGGGERWPRPPAGGPSWQRRRRGDLSSRTALDVSPAPATHARAVCSCMPSPARVTFQGPPVYVAWAAAARDGWCTLWLTRPEAHVQALTPDGPAAGQGTQADTGRARNQGIQKGRCHSLGRAQWGCPTGGPRRLPGSASA